MRTATASAALAATGALLARGAVLAVALGVGAIVLAFVALGAILARAEGKARDRPDHAAAVVAAVGSGLVALGAIAAAIG